ncbi:hypothetical protein Lepto7376_1535 [[Leptolyngbya] sp. PCC 7376]|uniref:SUKH-3 domain-containing protein n=1 Tax=[Leptolyngbya] sp. PCC 7376 TaxID=111781 RepID=UPI00029ED94C|nr:SUKH-3 domain-containing protein [[Leptolyngbya] sp. PCC 7376]AFY37878.1 hypothetical protein Lepto7376_1535 [[Leptolyngbya] sp. PCC 7376]
MMIEGSQLEPHCYVERYPELFAKLKAAGWTGKRLQGHHKSAWVREASLFILHPSAFDFLLQFEGLMIEAPSHISEQSQHINRIRFYPDLAFASMKTSAADYELDIEEILGDQEVFPVAEANGKVLFITLSCRAAFIDQSLCGYLRASNPFVLLNTVLFETDGDGMVEREVVPMGDRVTGRPMW